jgi:hypothetical protein
MPIMPNPVRICFVNLEEPSSYKGGKPRYSVSVLIPKTDPVNKKFIDDQVKAAANKGKDKFWKGKVPQGLKVLCQVPGQVMRDGDAEQRENGGTVGPEYKGCWFFTAAKPAAQGQPITMRRIPVAERERGRAVEEADPSIFYSGCTVKLDINLYPMEDNVINAGLNAVIFVKETPRLDGQPSKSAVIAAYTDEGVDEDEEDVPMTDDFNE